MRMREEASITQPAAESAEVWESRWQVLAEDEDAALERRLANSQKDSHNSSKTPIGGGPARRPIDADGFPWGGRPTRRHRR
jgi:hypothetical protein